VVAVVAATVFAGRRIARLLPRRPSLPLSVLAALAAAGALAVGLPSAPSAGARLAKTTLRPQPLPAGTRGPLVVVGLDGVDPDLLRIVTKARSLETFRAFIEDGLVSSLDNDGLGLSPVVWTTIITGQAPEQHRLTDFSVHESDLLREPLERWLGAVPAGFAAKSIVFHGLAAVGGLRSRTLTGSDRQGPSVFQIASQYGRRSLVVGYLMSFPAEKIDGAFLSEYVYDARLKAGEDVSRIAPGYAYPPALLAGPLGQVPAVAPKTPEVFEKDERRFEYTSSLMLRLLEEQQFDLVVFYTPWPDIFNHRLSHSEYQQMLAGRYEGAWPTRFVATYEKLDAFLGTLVKRLPEAHFLVLSDHGVAPVYSVTKAVSGSRVRFLEPTDESALPSHLRLQTDLGHLHSHSGTFLARGPEVRPGRKPSVSMYDIAPTILAYLGVPLARDFRGAPVSELQSGAATTFVDSYRDSVANERVEMQRSLSDEAAERLRALGYIE
jgi:hypothetical protein